MRTPLSLDDNDVRLNSAIGYITPKDMLAGRLQEIHRERGTEIGGGEGTAEESPPAGRVTDEKDYFRPVITGQFFDSRC